jgi:hypothetical protein
MLGAGLTYFGAVRRPGGVQAPPQRDWRGRFARVWAKRRSRGPQPPPEPPSEPPEPPESGEIPMQ